MKKRKNLILFMVLIGLIVALPQVANAWLTGWYYRSEITLSSATTVVDYQVKVELTLANFNYSHAQTNGEDIRFTDASDVLQDYWIEEWNTSGTSTIWVEVATSGTSTFYMYYDNSGASDASDGEETFLSFDDFEGASVDMTKWSVYGTPTGTYEIDNGRLKFTCTGTQSVSLMDLNQSLSNYAVGCEVEMTNWTSTINQYYSAYIYSRKIDTPNNYYYQQSLGNSSHNGQLRCNNGWVTLYTLSWAPSLNTVYNVELTANGTSFETFIDGTSEGSGTNSSHSTGGGGLGANRTTCYFDNYRVREYTGTDPTSTVGDEVPLPVVLSSFFAQYINSVPTIYWTTQSETNNIGWNVYRSESENPGQMIQINFNLIPGAGTTSIPTEYSYEDEYDVTVNNTYLYWIESVEYSGETDIYGPSSLTIPEEGENIPELPTTTVLKVNYPNPFNPDTKIEFDIAKDKTADLIIYNLRGQILESTTFKAGEHTYQWDASEYGSGIYFYKLKSDHYVETKKMIMLK